MNYFDYSNNKPLYEHYNDFIFTINYYNYCSLKVILQVDRSLVPDAKLCDKTLLCMHEH